MFRVDWGYSPSAHKRESENGPFRSKWFKFRLENQGFRFTMAFNCVIIGERCWNIPVWSHHSGLYKHLRVPRIARQLVPSHALASSVALPKLVTGRWLALLSPATPALCSPTFCSFKKATPHPTVDRITQKDWGSWKFTNKSEFCVRKIYL